MGSNIHGRPGGPAHPSVALPRTPGFLRIATQGAARSARSLHAHWLKHPRATGGPTEGRHSAAGLLRVALQGAAKDWVAR
eukprot:13003934-Alexandrium_andersonii.AAC.1